jgi:hypothetical protein
MMNFEQVDEKISKNGYRRHTGVRSITDDETGLTQKIYDYEHRRKLDMFSVYVNEYGSVDSIEFTRVSFNRETGKYSQAVTVISNLNELNKSLA